MYRYAVCRRDKRPHGMSCKFCAPVVKKAIYSVKSVKSVNISYEEKEAHLQYEGNKQTIEKMIKIIKDATGDKAIVAKGD